MYSLLQTDHALLLENDRLLLTRNGITQRVLRRVEDFHVEVQQGLIALVVTVRATFSVGSKQASKQVTLTARALPRNMGRMSWQGTGP